MNPCHARRPLFSLRLDLRGFVCAVHTFLGENNDGTGCLSLTGALQRTRHRQTKRGTGFMAYKCSVRRKGRGRNETSSLPLKVKFWKKFLHIAERYVQVHPLNIRGAHCAGYVHVTDFLFPILSFFVHVFHFLHLLPFHLSQEQSQHFRQLNSFSVLTHRMCSSFAHAWIDMAFGLHSPLPRKTGSHNSTSHWSCLKTNGEKLAKCLSWAEWKGSPKCGHDVILFLLRRCSGVRRFFRL